MRRLVSVCALAGLLAVLSVVGGGPAGARAVEGPGAPPRPAPAGAHWEYRATGPEAAPEAGAPEVVGGDPAAPGTLGYQVALVDPSIPGLNIRGQFCGGSLISPDTVLTAAHCVIEGLWVLVDQNDQVVDVDVDLLGPRNVDVLAGDVDLGAASVAERLDVRRINVSPDFTVDLSSGFDPFSPDVAVVQLASPSTTGTPVALAVPGQEALYPAGTPAVVSGWGNTGNPISAPPTRLQSATIPIVADGDCTTAFGTDVDVVHQLCAGDLVDGLPTPCYGDSGGPLVVDDAGEPLQVGVVQAGDGCPSPERPSVFGRVAAESAFLGRYLDPDEVPDRPERVRASQQGRTVRVSWRRPAFDGGTPITAYEVQFGRGVTVGPIPASGPRGHVDVDLGLLALQPGRTYAVKVRATNAVGTGAARVRSVTVQPYALP